MPGAEKKLERLHQEQKESLQAGKMEQQINLLKREIRELSDLIRSLEVHAKGKEEREKRIRNIDEELKDARSRLEALKQALGGL